MLMTLATRNDVDDNINNDNDVFTGKKVENSKFDELGDLFSVDKTNSKAKTSFFYALTHTHTLSLSLF